MAAPLSQDEIDALLSDPAEATDIADDFKSAPAAQDMSKSKSRTRYFGIRQSKPFRFKFRYNSPVIKRESVIVDPDPDDEVDTTVPVIRSIGNYARHRAKFSA